MGKPRSVLKEAAEPDSQDKPGITSFELCRSLNVGNSVVVVMNYHEKRNLGQREQENNFLSFLFICLFLFLRESLCMHWLPSERENLRVLLICTT